MWTVERIQSEVVNFIEDARTILREDISSIEDVKIEISTRMTRCKGRIEYSRRNGKLIATKIKIAKHLLDNYEDADIIEVIRHECVHFIVDMRFGKLQNHNSVFKKGCRALGISDSTYFIATPKSDAPMLQPKSVVKSVRKLENRYTLQCECGQKYHKKVAKKDSMKNWILYSCCHKCEGDLYVIDTKTDKVYYKSSGRVTSKSKKNFLQKETKSEFTCESDALATLKKLDSYSYAEWGNDSISDYESEFDYYWWRMLMVYDHETEYLSNSSQNQLYNWLVSTRKFTIGHKNTRI